MNNVPYASWKSNNICLLLPKVKSLINVKFINDYLETFQIISLPLKNLLVFCIIIFWVLQ